MKKILKAKKIIISLSVLLILTGSFFVFKKAKSDVCSQLFPTINIGATSAKEGEYYCEVTKITNNYAIGGMGQVNGGGAAWLAVKSGSVWKIVQMTQADWDCDLLRQYNIPESFAGSCLERQE